MIEITPEILLDESELSIVFVRSSGPGGQNVNKLATNCQLRFDLTRNNTLSDEVKGRVRHLAGRRVTDEGVLMIEAKNHRTQEQNRQEALQRLADLIRRALHPPKPRKPTRPTKAARQQRLDQKKHHSQVKQNRRTFSSED